MREERTIKIVACDRMLIFGFHGLNFGREFFNSRLVISVSYIIVITAKTRWQSDTIPIYEFDEKTERKRRVMMIYL